MILGETTVAGAWVIEPERLEDERGFFARIWDGEELAEHGLNPELAQCSIAHTRRRGTLRGLHYQLPPHEETKLVRCLAGSIFDLAVDLRPDSPTFKGWFGVELSAENRLGLYVPKGCAHGFLSLSDSTEVLYLISAKHSPEAARGARWDDPAFGIRLPGPVVGINERDRTFPNFRTVVAEGTRS
ncbi:dTDP-4-dehydrorhamnose 3,5-epimerase [soil metagenome]